MVRARGNKAEDIHIPLQGLCCTIRGCRSGAGREAAIASITANVSIDGVDGGGKLTVCDMTCTWWALGVFTPLSTVFFVCSGGHIEENERPVSDGGAGAFGGGAWTWMFLREAWRCSMVV